MSWKDETGWGGWASQADYEAYMLDLRIGQAVSITKDDGKRYHVPKEEWYSANPNPKIELSTGPITGQ